MILRDINDSISCFPLGLFLKKSKSIVISDLHIGFEHVLSRRGVLVPVACYSRMKKVIKDYVEISCAKSIILNGDLKEDIFNFSYQEYNELEDFFIFLNSLGLEVHFVRGNHDNFIKNFITKQNINIYEKYMEIDGFLITHGHISLDKEITESSCKGVIIGHEHAGISIKDDAGVEHKFKTIAKGSKIYGDSEKNIFVLPAFSPIKSSSDMNLKNKFMSPILQGINYFSYFVYEDGDWFV
jgi:putative SbcD/Mre11-related phosphoesterase